MVSVDRLKTFLKESDDVKHRYLLQQVEHAQQQITYGDVEDGVAAALVSYTREMEFTRHDARMIADDIDRLRDEEQTEFVFGDPIEEDLHKLVRELLLQLNADVIAFQNGYDGPE